MDGLKMRKIALTAGLLGLLVGVGCKHVGGKCDCQHDASNAELPAGIGSQPYATVGAPMPAAAVPEKLAAPMSR